MREQGKTIVIITHKLAEVLAISDDVTVMRDGKVVGRVKTKETNAAELARLMVGAKCCCASRSRRRSRARSMLSVRNLSVSAPDGANRVERTFRSTCAPARSSASPASKATARRELIEALAGLVDPGVACRARSRFEGTTLTGAGRASAARARHRAHSRRPASPRAAARLQPRRERDPRRALPAAVVDVRRVMLNEREIQRRTADIIRRFDVRPPNPRLPARALSGGNQQKLIIGREFELQPKLLLVAQPTRGVDIGAIEFIHRKLVALRDAGCAVLLVSAELEEVMSLSDRLLVIHDGRIAGEVDPQIGDDRQTIGMLMTASAAMMNCSRTALSAHRRPRRVPRRRRVRPGHRRQPDRDLPAAHRQRAVVARRHRLHAVSARRRSSSPASRWPSRSAPGC